jgi:hypothetical protein
MAYASVVWNLIMSTDANMLERERIQQRFVALHFNSFFAQAYYCYSFILEESTLYTLRIRSHRLDVLFSKQIYLKFKILSVLEIVGLRVPAPYIRDIALFSVCASCKNCPSARCASATNIVCRDADVFEARNVLLNRFLEYVLTYIFEGVLPSLVITCA